MQDCAVQPDGLTMNADLQTRQPPDGASKSARTRRTMVSLWL